MMSRWQRGERSGRVRKGPGPDPARDVRAQRRRGGIEAKGLGSASLRSIGARATASVSVALFSLPLLFGATMVLASADYEAILEWNGPYFRAVHAPAVDQLVDDPIPAAGTPFSLPQGVAAREHGEGERDVVYVLDTGNSRVQIFEANGTRLRAEHSGFNWRAAGVTPAASEFDDNQILLPVWQVTADRWVIPFSESVTIDGVEWRRVAGLGGFTPADRVYTINYGDEDQAPEILLPDGSLARESRFRIDYVVTDNEGQVTNGFGIGDIDYGISDAATKVYAAIDQSSGGPSSWQQVRAVALAEADAQASSDDLFLLDAGDTSIDQDEELFYFTIGANGGVIWREAYEDSLAAPWDVAVARAGLSAAATVKLGNDNGPFDQATAVVRDASQVTGHTYTVTVNAGQVSISDRTTGRLIIDNAPFADLADPFFAIPGIELRKNGAAGTSNTVTTTRAIPHRFLFVADTGSDRIKVIAAHGAAPTATDDWLPGDPHTGAAQPASSIGGTAEVDYRQSTPATVPHGWSAWTTTFPIAEGSLETIDFDPGGTPEPWSRIDDLAEAGPTDKVFAVDWQSGRILFGDGTHGLVPPGATDFEYAYATTPDVLRWGSAGSGQGEFASPKGIAARWNPSLGHYDVYVADTGNDRIQKLLFAPADPDLHLPARMEYVTSWTTASTGSDPLSDPIDVAVSLDGGDPARVWIAVADQANDRIVLYRDDAATTGGGGTAPAWSASLGGSGTELGSFGELAALTFLPNGSGLDLYAVDRTRGVVMKWERGHAPTISLVLTGGSALPQSYPPSGSYPFKLAIENAPDDGWVDLYFDTAAVFNAGTAKLCFTSGSVPATTDSVAWRFSSSPAGLPQSGKSYYLFARLNDAEGSVVASDQTSASELLRIDASLIPSVQAADALDGDGTLYLQNGLDRVITLQVAYPESVVAVGFSGTFDPDLVEITGITPGSGWDGLGGVNTLFNQSYNNSAGTFTVSTSVVGSPFGLTGPGPFPLARVALRARADALSFTSASTRHQDGTITLSKQSSGITTTRGTSPSSWVARTLNLRLAYLGDLATTGADPDSAAPHLQPRPDGRIDFADQMIFTLGWNGANHQQDRIADLGPVEGTAPDLRPNPDGRWDVDDILAFTTMFSWAGAEGYDKRDPERAEPAAPYRRGTDGAYAYLVGHMAELGLDAELEVDLAVDNAENLMGALFDLDFDPASLEVRGVESGRFLYGSDGELLLRRDREGSIQISVTRLDRGRPGVDGRGTVARGRFRLLQRSAAPLTLRYDLRAATGAILAQGSFQGGPFEGAADALRLLPAWPNPTRGSTGFALALDRPRVVTLCIYDASGREVRSVIDRELPGGRHTIHFDGCGESGEPLPSGVYFYRLGAGGVEDKRKLVLVR